MTAIRAIEAPVDYKPAIARITKALAKVSRETGKHQGLALAVQGIAHDLEEVVTAVETARKRIEREQEFIRKNQWLLGLAGEESIIEWLLK